MKRKRFILNNICISFIENLVKEKQILKSKKVKISYQNITFPGQNT